MAVGDRPIWLDYEYLARAIPGGILAFDAKGIITYASEKAGLLLKQDTSEVLGLTLEQLTTSGWIDVARHYTDEVQKGRESSFDFCFLEREGTEMWVRITLNPTIKDQENIGAVAILSDISGERRVRGKLRETEIRLRNAAAHMPGVIYELSYSPAKGLRVEYASEVIKKFTGFDADFLALNQTDLFTLLHPDDVNKTKKRIMTVANSLAPSSLQFRFRNGDDIFHMYTAASVVRSREGIVITGVAIDIGQLKIVESKLRASEAQLAAVFENFPFECWTIDLGAKFFLQNPASQRRLGDLRGKNIYDVPEEAFSCEECEPCIQLALQGKISRRESVVLVDGQHRHFDHLFAPILDGAEILGALGIVVDTTEQRELESQLAQSKNLDALGRLAGGIAHDFNNILTAIMSCVRLLERRLEGPPRRELQIIRDGAKRAAELTRQLLAFAKQEMVEPTRSTVDEILLKSDRLLRRLIGENIELVTQRNAKGWDIMVDPVRLEQAIINLVVNAKNSMSEGGRISVSSEAVTLTSSIESIDGQIPPGEYALISVSDSGAGMTDDTKARAFEPFFTTRHDVGGTGLGLSSVYGSVHQANGFVTLETAVDKGTKIGLYLPRAKVLTTECSEPKELERSGLHSGLQGSESDVGGENKKKTILLVEDEPLVRSVTFRSLCLSGYEVLQANSSESAQEISQSYNSEIDLLLTDVVMPQGTGPELAAAIQKKRPNIIVLFTSGYSRKFTKLPDDVAFLQKPFTPEQLEDRVRDALSKRA